MSINTIANQHLKIQVNSLGAEMQSFFDIKRNLECLWQADSRYWGRHAPILFPIVGRLVNDTLRHKNLNYPMSQHGFARDTEFTVVNKTNESIQLSLKSDENSLKQYPFNFELIVDYHLNSNQLITTYTICNPDNTILPASIGAHPAFNWPLDTSISKTNHKIRFNREEDCDLRRLNNGLLLEEKYDSPITNQQIDLNDALFEHDALIFDKLKSDEIIYSAGNELSITVSFKDFPHLGIWSKPEAPFICLEPWQGHSSPVDFDGEFSQKPGILLIPAQSEITKRFEIILD